MRAQNAGDPDLSTQRLDNSVASHRLSAQEQEWLADLYQANFAVVFRLCRRILRSPDDAADVAHETFLRALDSKDTQGPPKVARSWLLTIARNRCIDVLRSRERDGRLLGSLGDNPGRGADAESTIADRDFIRLVLGRLSLRERQALWQSAVESRPLAEIATGLQLNYMAAAQVLHRARRHAAEMAARLGVVIGIDRLVRALRSHAVGRGLAALTQSRLGPLTLERALSLAAVPLVVVAIKSSSSATRPSSDGSPPPAAVTSSIAAPAAAQPLDPKHSLGPQAASGALTVGNAVSLGVGSLPAGLTATPAALIENVNLLIGQLSGMPQASPPSGIAPLPSPAISPLPIATPTIPPLPIPTPTIPPLPVPTPSLPPLP